MTSADGRAAVAVNRSSGVITVLRLDVKAQSLTELISRKVEIQVGADAEPWSAVIGADDDTAYVLLRGRSQVIAVERIHTAPAVVEGHVTVGSEPTAIAITPSGRQLFVANWGDGTVSAIPTRDVGSGEDKRAANVSLNAALARTTVLGDVEARPALAHPRALAMTDDGDGDDADETLYATEFYSQPILGVAPTEDHAELDRNRQGFVYAMSVRTGQVAEPVALSPIDTTGFRDADGRETSCFPNQLYAAAVRGTRLYVTSVCTSPRGPLGPGMNGDPANFKTLLHPAVFVVDTEAGVELRDKHVVLTRALEHRYESDGTPDTSARRMPLIPVDLHFEARGASPAHVAWVPALGANAAFRIEVADDGSLVEIGAPGRRFVKAFVAGSQGRLPIGITTGTSPQPFGLLLSDVSQNVHVVDTVQQAVVSAVSTVESTTDAVKPANDPATEGRAVFATGLGPWSHQGQAWSSCESCHPEGGTDGVTWYFARGARQTLSTAETYDDVTDVRRVMLWTADVDEIHDVEAIVRGVSGGVGAVTTQYDATTTDPDCRVHFDGKPLPAGDLTAPCASPKRTAALHNGLNGSVGVLVSGSLPDGTCDSESAVCDRINAVKWDQIDAYLRTVQTPGRPPVDAGLATEGGQLFDQGRCSACHGGPGWTIAKMFYQPSLEANGTLAYPEDPMLPPNGELGLLRDRCYDVPEPLRALNPRGSTGSAPFRSPLVGSAADPDQLNCVLRDVGTFPVQVAGSVNSQGIVPEGAPPTLEATAATKTETATDLGLGVYGFNVPSLLGLATSAPYFHAGNARTLEEVFDGVFARHHQSGAPGFLDEDDPDERKRKVNALVAFLLSIDDDQPERAPSMLGTPESPVDPILCREPSQARQCAPTEP